MQIVSDPEHVFDKHIPDDSQPNFYVVSYPSPLHHSRSETDFRKRLRNRQFGAVVVYERHGSLVVFGIEHDVLPGLAAAVLRDDPGICELQFKWLFALRFERETLIGALLDTEPATQAARSYPQALPEAVEIELNSA